MSAQTDLINPADLLHTIKLQDAIVMDAKADDKWQALSLVADEMLRRGLVAKGYDHRLVARERQASTYLGQSIAIPHGTLDGKGHMHHTGVVLMHFADGVKWTDTHDTDAGKDGHNARRGGADMVYLVVGIAAKGDEYLSVLRQLTRLLNDDASTAIQNARAREDIIGLFTDSQSSTTVHQHTSTVSTTEIAEVTVAPLIILPKLVSLGAVGDWYEFLYRGIKLLNACDPPLVGAELFGQLCQAQVAKDIIWLGHHVAMLGMTCTKDAGDLTIWYNATAVVGIYHRVSSTEQVRSVILLLISSVDTLDVAHLDSLIDRLLLVDDALHSRAQSDEHPAHDGQAADTQTPNIQATDTRADSLNADQLLGIDAQALARQLGLNPYHHLPNVQAVLTNRHGLHARPDTELSKLASNYSGEADVSADEDEWVSAKSLTRLLSLGINYGQTVHLIAKPTATTASSADEVVQETRSILDTLAHAIRSGLGEKVTHIGTSGETGDSSDSHATQHSAAPDSLPMTGLSADSLAQAVQKSRLLTIQPLAKAPSCTVSMPVVVWRSQMRASSPRLNFIALCMAKIRQGSLKNWISPSARSRPRSPKPSPMMTVRSLRSLGRTR